MKRLRTSVARALEKGQIKVGDEVWVKVKVGGIDPFESNSEKPIMIKMKGVSVWIHNTENILITKPEPKPIDFSTKGRVLRHTNGDIVKTTGYQESSFLFSAIVLDSIDYKKGYGLNNWLVNADWQDITDTYQP